MASTNRATAIGVRHWISAIVRVGWPMKAVQSSDNTRTCISPVFGMVVHSRKARPLTHATYMGLLLWRSPDRLLGVVFGSVLRGGDLLVFRKAKERHG